MKRDSLPSVTILTLTSASITGPAVTNSNIFSLTYGQVVGTYTSYCVLENDTSLGNCSFIAGSLPSSFTTSTTENSKVLSIWIKDSAGNTSSRVDTNSVMLDTTAPALASASISNSSPTPSTLYGLTYGAVTGSYASYCIRENDTVLANCTFTAGSLPSSFTVSTTENAKILSVWLKDMAGNVSARVDTNSITLDTTAPILASATVTNSSPTKNTTFSLTFGAITGSYASYCIRENDTVLANCSFTTGTLPASYTVSGIENGKVLSVWIKDAAGNVSSRVDTNTVTLDTTAPVLASATVTNTNPTNNNTYSLSYGIITGTYASYCIRENDTVLANCTFTAGTLPASLVVSSAENAKMLSIWLKDAAGNVSSRVDTNSVTLDTTPPSAPVVSLNSTSPTNLTAVTLTVSDCTDRPYVLVNEGSQPGFASTPWVTCSTTAGALTYTLSAGQGTHTLKVWAQDSAGNISLSSGNVNVVYDSINPVITLGSIPNQNPWDAVLTIGWTVTEATISNARSFTVEISPDGGASWSTLTTVASTFGPLVNAPFSTNWTIPHWSTVNARVRVSITDLAGNSGSTTSSDLAIDNFYPSVSLTGTPTAIQGGTIVSLNLQATAVTGTLTTVDLDYASDGVTFTNVAHWTPGIASFSQPAYAWNVPPDNVVTGKLRLIATNTVPASSTAVSPTFAVDSIAPTLSNASFTINGGAASTYRNNLQLSLQASDNLTKITSFCIKKDPAAPLDSDSCWRSVTASPPNLTPAINLTLANYPYLLGFNPGTYTFYAWVKDEAGNHSSLSNAGAGTTGKDKQSITYNAPIPSHLVNILATARDGPATPPDPNLDLFVPSGTSVIVKWKATSAQALPPTPISLSYTTDGTTYTTLANGLADGQGSGCTIDANHTGCTTITSPTSSSYSIRVTLADSQGLIVSASAASLNSKPLNMLAGNTDPGLNGSANTAVIFQKDQNSTACIANALAVSSTGKFFILEKRGLIVIDPADGLYKVLIPTTGVTTDGPVSSATLKGPTMVTMDFQDRLLIQDTDRIRRVDLATNTISTFIGGGGLTNDGTPASQFAVSDPGNFQEGAPIFTALPNGDLWFQISGEHYTVRDGHSKIRIYKASLDQVFSLTPTGTGSAEDAAYDPTTYTTYNYGIRFDPTTSAVTQLRSRSAISVPGGKLNRSTSYDPITGASITPHIPFLSYWGEDVTINGRSGEMYSADHLSTHGIYKYDIGSNSWTRVLGSGGLGQCADGTPATSCSIDTYTFYVGDNDQLYFIDRGKIRTIDSLGNVITLFGQSRSFGDGGDPTSARFNKVVWLDRINDGRIVVKDELEYKIREITIGGTISTIAGNGLYGAPDTTNPANAQPIMSEYWGGDPPFVTNPVNGDILYTRDNSLVSILERTTGLWRDLAGTGATSDLSADGLPGNQINFYATSAYPTGPIGFNGTEIMRHRHNWDGSNPVNGFLKIYALSDGTQSHFSGQMGTLAGSIDDCAGGTAIASCGIPQTIGNNFSKFGWDSETGRWLFGMPGSPLIHAAAQGGTISHLYSAPEGILSFAYVKKGANHFIYYCSSSSNHVRRYAVETATDIALTWTNNTVACGGYSMVWDPNRHSVIFPITQNGLTGIAEYYDP